MEVEVAEGVAVGVTKGAKVVGTGPVPGDAVADGLTTAVAEADGLAVGDAVAETEGTTTTSATITTGGFKDVWSLLTSSAENRCTPGDTLFQV